MEMKEALLIEGIITVHELAVKASYWLIGLHIAAAVFHRFKGDGVWNSLVPVWKEKETKQIELPGNNHQ